MDAPRNLRGMSFEEKAKLGYVTSDVTDQGYPFTRKGIDNDAARLELIKGDKPGEYISTAGGTEKVLVFNGIGFSILKGKNPWEKYMDIK